VEAALEVVCDFGDVGDVDVLVLLVVLGELEVDLLREEVLQEEVHQLGVLLLLEVVVREHRDAAADHQLAARLLVLVERADGAVAGVGEGARGEDGVGGRADGEAGAVDEDEVDAGALGLLLVLLLVFVAAAEHEAVVALALGLLGVAVGDAGDFLVEDAVVDVGLLGVEVLVEGGPDDAVGVDDDAELLGDFGDVGVVPAWAGGYLRSPPSWEKMRRLPPFSTKRLRSSISVGVKVSFGAPTISRCAFLIFSKSIASLFSPIWVLHNLPCSSPCISSGISSGSTPGSPPPACSCRRLSASTHQYHLLAAHLSFQIYYLNPFAYKLIRGGGDRG
jgi:hypothetical protein